MDTEDILTLARTLYGEAEANNETDAEAIAHVVMNRVRLPNWPDDISEVCLQPWQFSCWNQNDPNRARILKAKGAWFDQCKQIAETVAKGLSPDPTNRSTHYFASYVKRPAWAKGKKDVYSVPHSNNSKHLFFNNIDTAPPKTAKEALEVERPLGNTGTIKAARLGVSGAAATGLVSEITDQVNQGSPVFSLIAPYAPWVMVGLLLVTIGFIVWRRIDDRNKGLR